MTEILIQSYCGSTPEPPKQELTTEETLVEALEQVSDTCIGILRDYFTSGAMSILPYSNYNIRPQLEVFKSLLEVIDPDRHGLPSTTAISDNIEDFLAYCQSFPTPGFPPAQARDYVHATATKIFQTANDTRRFIKRGY